MIKGLTKLAWRNTLRRGKKSWITVIAVFIGIAAVVSLVSLGQGLETAIKQEFEDLGANNVYVSGNLDSEDIEIIERAAGVDETAAYYSSTETVKFQGETAFTTVYGVDLDSIDLIFSSQGWSVDEGRQLRTTDSSAVLLGSSFEDNFENSPEIRSQIGIEGSRFRTVGTFTAGDPSAQNSVVVSLERAQDLYDIEDEISQVNVKVQPGFTQQEVQENIERQLRRDRNLEEGEEDFSTSTPQDILESLTGILGVVQGIVAGLASISLLVGGIGIMNTMYMAINERTQEIGVLKATGASKRQIRLLFLMEAGLIGLIGGLIGLAFGIGVSEVAILASAQVDSVDLVRAYSPLLILGSLGFATLLGLVSGYLPARRASNLEPADALRYE